VLCHDAHLGHPADTILSQAVLAGLGLDLQDSSIASDQVRCLHW
jgi:hypothetical protein